MNARQIFPDGALTVEQWQLLQELGRTLTPVQARWISGYFAGLDAGLLRAEQSYGSDYPAIELGGGAQGRTLTLLYGTETGNSAALAKALAEAARGRGLSPKVADMASYKPRGLKDEQDVLIIVSTYGEGDPPQPAAGFFEFVEGNRAPKLDGVRFAILALGDSSYEKYCEAGKRLDRRFEELGATRLQPRVDCDIDYDEPAAAWSEAVVEQLAVEAAKPVASAATFPTATPAAAPVHDKRNPFAATVLENIRIVGRGSTKETRHLELDISGSGLAYGPGDALGIAVTNEPAVVEAVLELAGLSADTEVAIKGDAISLGEALQAKLEITTATPRFLDQWAKLSGSDELETLRADDRAADRNAFLHNHHIVDILRRFPVKGVEPDAFVAGLRPLQPRLYSIASSLLAVPDEVHLTVAPVRYDLHGRPRNGVASSLLADRIEAGATLPVYIQANPHFRLPEGDAPIIMVGAGTGVAPYRAFLQQREAEGRDGRRWLFFGERNFRSDFLYQAEWQELLKSGVLTRMDVAFSRDTAGKIYVQQRMRERAAELFAWLEEGAHLYVCGDAANMAPDVHQALIEIVESQAGTGREAAVDYVRKLQADQRYQRDVY